MAGGIGWAVTNPTWRRPLAVTVHSYPGSVRIRTPKLNGKEQKSRHAMDDPHDGTIGQDATDGALEPRPKAKPRQGTMPRSPRATVLVVDDEKEICELVSYNLAREGYRVVKEHDGEAAVDRIFKSPPDLLVLDLLLPKMSGLEVLQAIRSEPRTRSLPVLVLTARGTEMDKLVGFERGADDYLTKPFSPKELVARVSAILRRSRGEDPQTPAKIGPFRFDRERHQAFVRER